MGGTPFPMPDSLKMYGVLPLSSYPQAVFAEEQDVKIARTITQRLKVF